MKLLYIIFLLFLPITAFCQGKIKGIITNKDRKPIPFTNVLLLNSKDTSFVKGVVSNELGEYLIDKVNSGKYVLKFSAIGYHTTKSNVLDLENSSAPMDIGPTIMVEEINELKEIVVEAEKPLYHQEIDRTVVNVQSSVLTKGSSALQVLERSPGVYVDRLNNNIVLNGKGGVMVMQNGKLMRLSPEQVITLLNGMSANNIEKLELLSTPPSKYDSEGSGGMINIVLKKGEGLGTKGSISLTGGYGVAEKAVSSLNFTHNMKKINLYSSYSFSHDRSASRSRGMAYENPPVMGEVIGRFSNRTKLLTGSHNATLGIDARVSPKTSIGSSIIYNYSKVVSNVSRGQQYTILPDSFLLMKASIDGPNSWNNIITNVYLEREFSEGEKVNIDIDYLYYLNRYSTRVNSNYLDKDNNNVPIEGGMFAENIRGGGTTPIRIGVAKIDYTKKISEKVNLEAGAKGTYTINTSSSENEQMVDNIWINIDGTSSKIDMTEGIGAIHSSMTAQINSSTKLIVGARYEYSRTKLDSEIETERVDRKMGKLFPNVFLSKKLNNKSNLQFSYTERITRPSYNDLASFLSWRGPYVVSTGNPWLKPTVTKNLKAGFNYNEYTFSVLLSRDDYPIYRSQVVESPDGNLMYIAPQNLKYQNTLNFQLDLPIKVSNWWSISQGFVGGWKNIKLDHTEEKLEKTFFLYSIYGTQRFKLPKSFSLEISGWYHSPRYEGSVKLYGFGMVSAGIKKELKENMGSFQLTVDDIFKTFKLKTAFGQLTDEAFSLHSRSTYNVESSLSQIVKLTYFKSFGNNKVKDLNQRGAGSMDERGRVRKN